MRTLFKPAVVILILAAFFIAAPSLFALSGLSVQLGTGYNNDGMNMASNLKYNGIGNVSHPDYYNNSNIKNIYASERELEILKKNGVVKNLEISGSTRGLNLSLGLRLDFLKFMFVRVDGEYETNVTGYQMEWNWNNPSGFNYRPMDGMSSFQSFDYQYMSVPLFLGLNIPVRTKGAGIYNIYLGAGPVWGRGEYAFEVDHPERVYVNNSWIDVPYQIHEEMHFSSENMGFAWIVGMNAEIFSGLFVFFEYRNVSFVTDVDSYMFKSSPSNMLTNYVPFSVPMNLASGIVRVGLLYNIVSFSGK